jgi:hypothetical protein
VNNATNYEIQVSTDGTFSDATKIAIDKTGANRLGNQLAYQDTTVSLAPNMTYFWRVRAYISSSGISSAWSPASAFRTTSTTSSTTAVSPTVALAAAEATGKLEVVTAFDYSTGTYQAYVPGLPGNKLTTISPNSVIFVTLKQNATVKVSGVSFEVKANTPTPLPVGSTVSIEVTLK